jgi:hypothetical protein
VGEIILLQRRRFRIAGTARKTKPQRSHAPPAKPNSTAEHRRRANPGPSWTRLRPYEDSVLKRWTPAPPPPAVRPEARGREPQTTAPAESPSGRTGRRGALFFSCR